uniref:Uncharacterized protein n=1 Tax=Arundo donax TaxID=35708 RepID=A0A0A9DZD3_ARUDO
MPQNSQPNGVPLKVSHEDYLKLQLFRLRSSAAAL